MWVRMRGDRINFVRICGFFQLYETDQIALG